MYYKYKRIKKNPYKYANTGTRIKVMTYVIDLNVLDMNLSKQGDLVIMKFFCALLK